jgi:two-component system sensor histidine kinase CreC
LGAAFEEMRDALEGKHSVERYVQTLTHEINGPLSAIRGAVELLKEDMPHQQQRRFIENITSESERVGSIVEKLLLLSSLESRKTIADSEIVEMEAIVRELLQSLSPLMEGKHLRIEVTAGNGPTAFRGDAFLVRHAISNVLRNAIDFIPPDGTIKACITKDHDQVLLIIDDNGPGIPEYARHRIFERFYSLKRPDTGRKSSGLGLSIVKEIMDLHGGSVELSDAPEGGTRVYLRFPISRS